VEAKYRRVTHLKKEKSNDFGAGGVSVAIGELADGLDIYLDRVPTKYSGLNPTELAISESQERMAVVVEKKDQAAFEHYCHLDNIEVTHVADVTDTGRMRQFYKDQLIADLSRAFIDSAGAKHYAAATILPVEERNPFRQAIPGNSLSERISHVMSSANVTSQKGLIEEFDATIGRSTVLMPFGGHTQRSETQVSVQKLPTDGLTNTASIMAFGYNPFIAEWSPYHGAAYAVVEACSKVVAAGADYSHMRFSYQEYFERMTEDRHSWGKPLSALLGALKMQVALGLPSIGGKDSMSGTFEHISVPPTLIAFGITTVPADKVISTDLKKAGNRLYLLQHKPLANYMPNTDQLKHLWADTTKAIQAGKIVSAYSIGFGGVCEALAKMSFGNELGAEIQIDEAQLYNYQYGSILVEATAELAIPDAVLLGQVTDSDSIVVNGEAIRRKVLYDACVSPFRKVYPATMEPQHKELLPKCVSLCQYTGKSIAHEDLKGKKPIVYIPVFPGTNCDYDSAKAWRKAGAEVEVTIFRNLDEHDVIASIDEMVAHIEKAQILMLAGGFSLGDEPDGSAKFIVSVLNNSKVSRAVESLLDRGGLILGICNGFQALIKSGLLPYGKLGQVTTESPTLFRNDINRHVSQMVTTTVASTNSPWLQGMSVGDLHSIAVSHGEGKLVVSEELAKQLFENGQVAFRYADPCTGQATMESPYNPNGSCYAIEGLLSPNGQILGKMGHTERYEENVFANITGNKCQPLFENAVNHFKH